MAGGPGERLQQVQPRDDQAVDRPARVPRVATDVGERLDVGGQRVTDALGNRDREAGEANAAIAASAAAPPDDEQRRQCRGNERG